MTKHQFRVQPATTESKPETKADLDKLEKAAGPVPKRLRELIAEHGAFNGRENSEDYRRWLDGDAAL